MSRAPLVMAKAARGVRARQRDRLRQHARLALREPADGGDARHARARRDGRAGRRAATRCRARTRTPSRSRAAAPPGAAQAAGRFADELVAVEHRAATKGPGRTRFEVDEHPRPDDDRRAARDAARRRFARAAARVTAGQLVGHQRRRGGDPAGVGGWRSSGSGCRRSRASSPRAVAGVEPKLHGPRARSRRRKKALARAGIATAHLDLVELNEAFAAQAIPCVRELDLDPARVNVNGGAIALGPPARLLGRAAGDDARARARRARRGHFGLASMCIGVGQGIAAIFERA